MKLHIDEWGEGDASPVFCVHGVRSHSLRFELLAQEHLADRFHIVSVDLRGHGYSSWEPPWNIETHLADLIETADSLGIGAAHWIGHSFGGRLTMEIAARWPERVEQAVLLDPAIQLAPLDAMEAAEAERPDLAFPDANAAIQHRLDSGTVFHTPRELLERDMEQHLVRGEDGLLRMRFSQNAVIAAWGEMVREPPLPTQTPTLLVVPDQAPIVTSEQIDACRRALGDLLQVVIVPGGHLVLFDAYEETARAITDFLA